jgi:putative Mg2+ transporter-C (MgtC) family protein
MPVTIGWEAIAIRLLLALIAGLVIGINRDESGRPAGMRTNLLVCLAAAVAMIQANLLMNSTGKAANSFVVLDLMRLPLGILSGIGFIGAGTILRRESMVTGVTTAATIWFVTVIGLCFGGGQLRLGIVSTLLALAILWNLRWVEDRMSHTHQATLVLFFDESAPEEETVWTMIKDSGVEVVSWGVEYDGERHLRRVESVLKWKAQRKLSRPPALTWRMAGQPGISSAIWKP